MQVMAVGAGGSLEQHLPDVLGATAHDPGGDAFGEVEVTIAAGQPAGEAPGAGDQLSVRCHHHQAVREHPVHARSAWADDGTLEAMEATGRPVPRRRCSGTPRSSPTPGCSAPWCTPRGPDGGGAANGLAVSVPCVRVVANERGRPLHCA